MVPPQTMFQRSIREQIAVNRARTPTERFQALCDLLDAVRAMAPKDPAAVERRRRAAAVRERDREKLREFCKRHAAAGWPDAEPGV